MKTLVLVIFPLLMSLTAEGALGNDVIDITEWRVPWQNTRPRDPFVDTRNRVWFVGQTGDYIAYLDPSTGKFERLDLEQGTGPHNLVVDRTRAGLVRGQSKGLHRKARSCNREGHAVSPCLIPMREILTLSFSTGKAISGSRFNGEILSASS